jgi:UDP-N-acetylmuramoyl-tripeptide--D-alanyl-D-alanine ligase
MDIEALYELYLQHPVISTDSRNCPHDSLFFALKGESFNGNRFAEQALETAAYAILDDPHMKTGKRMLLTDDVLQTLQQLACFHRKTLGIPVIGITGTNGKTTTKELLASVLSTGFNTLYTAGNYNNHIGVPLTLLRLTDQHEIAVIEMGANHPGEINELCGIALPDYGIITNVGYAHLEGFGSFEGVIRTKGELYDYIRKTNGTVFIDRDNAFLLPVADGINQITYGTDKTGFVYGEMIDCNPHLRFRWESQNEAHIVSTHLVGSYNLSNILAAIAVGLFFAVPPNLLNEAISTYVPQNNRSQLKKTDRNELIIDAYNANPSSMKAALTNFSLLKAAPKTVILGDMLELGSDSISLHEEVILLLKEMKFDQVILCGTFFCSLDHCHLCFQTIDQLCEYLKEARIRGQHILIKGSHGIHLEKTIDFL